MQRREDSVAEFDEQKTTEESDEKGGSKKTFVKGKYRFYGRDEAHCS